MFPSVVQIKFYVAFLILLNIDQYRHKKSHLHYHELQPFLLLKMAKCLCF